MRHLLALGFDVNIVGYDEPYEGATVESLLRRYEYMSRPFGHELVIFAMVMLEPEKRPWTRYALAHPETYKGFEVALELE